MTSFPTPPKMVSREERISVFTFGRGMKQSEALVAAECRAEGCTLAWQRLWGPQRGVFGTLPADWGFQYM